MIEAQSISKSFESNGQLVPIIDALNLSVEQGRSASIQGASGCGKSTLLYILSGLEAANSGKFTVANLQIDHLNESELDHFRSHAIGLVFQQFHLIDCLSVWANITFTARLAERVDIQYLNMLCDKLGLTQHKQKPVSKLSGGEQQRVALARALAHKPKVLFADEPTGNLDESTSEIVTDLIYKTCSELNITLLLVTHSKDVALRADSQYKMHLGKLVMADNASVEEPLT